MRSFPIPPQTQALSSSTFRAPPLDGSLSLPEIYDWHSEHSPNHVLFEFVGDDGQLHSITWRRVVHAIHRAARTTRARLGYHPDEAPPSCASPPVIAVLAPSETISYFTLLMGILRAGFSCFPISPRNSPAAIAHLLQKASVSHILVGRDEGMRGLISSALSILRDHTQKLTVPDRASALPSVSDIPVYQDLYPEDSKESDKLKSPNLSFNQPGSETIAIILHSSGSTAFPKPISWSHAGLIMNALIPYFGQRDLCGRRWSAHCMPMFHGMGVQQTLWAPASGFIITAFKPQLPPTIPLADNVIKAAFSTKSDIVFCVPSFVETWAKDPELVAKLSKIDGILYGGGPLERGLGDFMARSGVTIFILYGTTEIGMISPILPGEVGMDWEYFRIAGNMTGVLLPDGQGHSELLVKPTPFNTPAVLNTTHDGVECYSTSDLLEPHPTRPGYWRVYGRVDDQIMHSTGEKTNPGPLECIMNQDPHVQSSVMFGRSRLQPGILIDPKPESKFGPEDQASLARFKDLIWPTVEKLNGYAPQHSRIFRECILVASPAKPFTYTAKNTARRQAILTDYEDEINRMYDSLEATTQSDVDIPETWDHDSTLSFVRKVVYSVLEIEDMQDDDDIFTRGCDSLQATWIRNIILQALRANKAPHADKITQNVVYEYPSILALTLFVETLLRNGGGYQSTTNGIDGAVSSMRAMAAKYTKNLPRHTPIAVGTPGRTGQVILLTGTTGALGTSILAELVTRQEVLHIYAFNRHSRNGLSLKERQCAALIDHGFDPTILLSNKVTLLEGSTSRLDLGLEAAMLNKLRDSVTHIMHNAWRVDFNLSLSSFEENIKGLRHLVEFALSCPSSKPPAIIFTSSISVVHQARSHELVKESSADVRWAVGSGYSESKWVAEEILRIASEKTSLQTTSVRVGQICGGLNGSWNATEWLPSLVRSSLHLHCFPLLEGCVSWIPLHDAAAAMADFCHTSAPVLHLTHPKPVSWNEIATEMAQCLDVPLVPYQRWLELLKESACAPAPADGVVVAPKDQMVQNPALRIMNFYRSIAASRAQTAQSLKLEAVGNPCLSIEEALERSKTLRERCLQGLGKDDVHKWFSYWRHVGFLP